MGISLYLKEKSCINNENKKIFFGKKVIRKIKKKARI